METRKFLDPDMKFINLIQNESSDIELEFNKINDAIRKVVNFSENNGGMKYFDPITKKMTSMLIYIMKCPPIKKSLDLKRFKQLRECLENTVKNWTVLENNIQGFEPLEEIFYPLYTLFDTKNPELLVEIEKMKQCGNIIGRLINKKNIMDENTKVCKAVQSIVGIVSLKTLVPFLHPEKVRIMIYGEIREILRATLLAKPKKVKIDGGLKLN